MRPPDPNEMNALTQERRLELLAASAPSRSTACASDRHPGHAAFVAAAYERFRPILIGRLVVATRDPTLAEDCVQDAATRLLREVCAGRAPQNVGGWLHRVAMNAVVSRARHHDVERRHAPAAGDDSSESPEAAVAARESARSLQTALAELSDADRTLILIAAEGWTRAEIAAHVGRSEVAVGTALCRARARLRRSYAAA